jgi:sterol desaturase/sphingolipid hydroxylase (fatty acid hydroxylase superfamily)
VNDLAALTVHLVRLVGLPVTGFGFVVVQSVLVLGAFALAYLPIEWAFRRRQQRVRRPRWLTDVAFFFGQYWVFGLASAWVLTHVRDLAGLASPTWFGRWPLWLQAGVVIVLGDLCVYWAHRAQHRFEILWRFHAVHHTAEHLDWLAAHREHPLDGLYTQLWVNLPAMLLGFGVGAIGGLVTLRGMWAIFIHSNARVPLGPLKYVLGSPEQHEWHHAKTSLAQNFGNLAPWTDLLFGTHTLPEASPQELGIDAPAPKGYLGLLLWPFL